MLEHWIWLATRPGVREHIALTLVRSFPNIEALYLGGRRDYMVVEGIRDSELDALEDKSMDLPERLLDTCCMAGIHILAYCDAAYPERLRNLPDPPLLLYYKGIMPMIDMEPAIGVVGTRNASAYGCRVAQSLGYQIAKCGGMIVSGMAMGIDSMAMGGCLTAGGKTIGVLGCGVDVVYPTGNKALRMDVERYGCILSEYPPGTRPVGWHFPRRNRLISGLSCGIVVVEAPEQSGALITARHALDQGRDVFAVPGNVDAYNSAGCNQLLKDGAKAVQYGWDVMQEYQNLFPKRVHQWSGSRPLGGGIQVPESTKAEEKPRSKGKEAVASPMAKIRFRKSKTNKTIDKEDERSYSDGGQIPEGLTKNEEKIVKNLTKEPIQVDEIITKSGLKTSQVLAALTLLEVKGHVVRHPGKYYSLPGSSRTK